MWLNIEFRRRRDREQLWKNRWLEVKRGNSWKFYFLIMDHHLSPGDTLKGFKPDEHKRGQILAKVCLYLLGFIIPAPLGIPWPPFFFAEHRCRGRSYDLVFHSSMEATIGRLVCSVCLSSASTHAWEIPRLSQWAFKFWWTEHGGVVRSRSAVHVKSF